MVAKARAANETSGAQSGARVAEYLRGGLEARPTTEKLLEKLSLPAAAQPVMAPRPATSAAAPKVDDKKLAAMTQANPPTPQPVKPAPAPEAAAADLSQANEKLSSLLGKQK